MRVTVKFETTYQEDGCEQVVTLERDNVEDVEDLLDFYGSASRAAGYSYVDRVGYADEKGSTTWSKF